MQPRYIQIVQNSLKDVSDSNKDLRYAVQAYTNADGLYLSPSLFFIITSIGKITFKVINVSSES